MKNFIKGFFTVFSSGIILLFAAGLLFRFAGTPAFLQHNTSAENHLENVGETDITNTAAGDGSAEKPYEASVQAASDGENPSASEENDDDFLKSDTNAEIKSDEAESTESAGSVLLSFAGDVMFSDEYLKAYDQDGISAIADETMLSHMQNADLFILNEEFPFSRRGTPMPDKQFTFRTDPKYVKIFEELGADIVSLANNHALDYGRDAFTDTLETLDQSGIQRIGGGYDITEASSPATCTINGQSFAIFGATRVSPSADWYAGDSRSGLFQTYDPAKLNAAIENAGRSYDHVIVFVHWGIEKSETPEAYQRELARGYIDVGADLVVGAHPHVLQGFEYYKGVPIIYSLGNYLFDNRTGQTLLLETTFSEDGPPAVKLVPCQRQSGVLKALSDPSALYQKLSDLSFDVTVDENGSLQPLFQENAD